MAGGRDTLAIDAYFDCSCVWAWLALEHATRFAPAAAALRWRPVLAAQVFDQVNRAVHWPMTEVKQTYYRGDLVQWADYLGLALAQDPPQPDDMTDCMLACVAAGRWERGEAFASAAMQATFAQRRDLADRGVLAGIWKEAGLPESVFEESLAWPGIGEELAANTAELTARGGFGVPTFFLGDRMFFGNDAVPLLERAVTSKGRQA
jgi:2-hydroxychromene-2-carboxylate isomerase